MAIGNESYSDVEKMWEVLDYFIGKYKVERAEKIMVKIYKEKNIFKMSVKELIALGERLK